MDAVMPQLGFRGGPLSHAISGIRRLITRCLQREDTERPTSVMIVDNLKRMNVIPRQGSMIRDVAYLHLLPPIARMRVPFWRHETLCHLCRRLLKAGGVGYVEDFDSVRADRCRNLKPNESLPAMPRSMGMTGLSRDQSHSVQLLRANGESKETATICIWAMAALRGSIADGKEVAAHVFRGAGFQQAAALVHQRKLQEAQGNTEDEDSESD